MAPQIAMGRLALGAGLIALTAAVVVGFFCYGPISRKEAGRSNGDVSKSGAALKGPIELPPSEVEAIGEVSEADLKAAAAKVRKAHPQGGTPMWKALAELVRPGMTVEQMRLALPAALQPSGLLAVPPVWLWNGMAFRVTYALDANHTAEASGIGTRGRGAGRLLVPVLTARPQVRTGDSAITRPACAVHELAAVSPTAAGWPEPPKEATEGRPATGVALDPPAVIAHAFANEICSMGGSYVWGKWRYEWPGGSLTYDGKPFANARPYDRVGTPWGGLIFSDGWMPMNCRSLTMEECTKGRDLTPRRADYLLEP